jgi:hypothetical protein
MANLKQFSATPAGNSVSVKAMYDDGTTLQFSTDKQSADFMISIVQLLSSTADRLSAAENRAAAATRTADRMRKRTGDSFAENGNPTKCDAEFMRMVRVVSPKYRENTPDDDPRLVALDVLRYAPVEAYSAVSQKPLSEIQLNEAIDILSQVGDYMKANNIEPKMLTDAERVRATNDAAAKFWGKK